ncbi:hypothetical protein WICPIJ_003178 [Wickerhamomyces pijperi]|uniref:Uncharacterized protein n=1 Tax=Wickerhamomyces pijperi TaxID=599730 RepID=A0A9P8TP48_WICPI|nr:hypothetical protein WICPIJ_003178 [Wickerhamomyces pijperi]
MTTSAFVNMPHFENPSKSMSNPCGTVYNQFKLGTAASMGPGTATTTSYPDTVNLHIISKPTEGFLKNDFQAMENYSWKLDNYANTHDSVLSAYIEDTDILMKEFMKGAVD